MKRLIFLPLICFLILLLTAILTFYGCANAQDLTVSEILKKVIEEDIKACKEKCKTYNSPGVCKRICEKEIFDPRWRIFSFDSFGSAHFYDSESIVVSGNIVKVWKKMIYSERGKQYYIKWRIQDKLNVKGYKNLDYSLDLFKIDCFEKKLQILETIDYASDGSILESVDIPEFLAEWSSITPGSVEEGLYEEVCKTEK
jgi:hypothetical protein